MRNGKRHDESPFFRAAGEDADLAGGSAASERLAVSIIEQAGEAIVVCDKRGRIIRASRLAHQLCGNNPLLKSFDAMWPLWMLEAGRLFSVAAPLRGESLESIEVEYRRDGEQAFHLLLNATPLRSSDGAIIGCVVTLADITGRKLAEQEREASLEFLRLVNGSASTRDLIRAAVDFFQRQSGCEAVGIRLREGDDYPYYEVRGFPREFVDADNSLCDRDGDGEIIRDAAGCPVIACMCGNVILGRFNPALPFFTAHGSFWTNSMTELMASTTEAERQTRMRNRCNGDGYESMALIPLLFGDERVGLLQLNDRRPGLFTPDAITLWQKFSGYLTMALAKFKADEALIRAHEELERRVRERTEDLAISLWELELEIAERQRTSEALREKERMLIQQSRLAAMGEMIGNIAHQWRQPLNVLGLTIQQLLLFYDDGQFSREFLAHGVDSSMKLIQHMSRTIDDFRDYFRPDKEKVEFRLGEAVSGALALMEGSLGHHRIATEVFSQCDPAVIGYRNEFAQVILNILSNAVDIFRERGIENPKVTITIGHEGERAVVAIADNAGGIPGEIMEKVFDPYFTTKSSQSGTGLGLFMSKSIIEKNMNGTLTVRNSGDGAEFKIEV
ncbi:MAG: ATP-binding protein [Oryzomonas sp.]|uniref:ATP-binding protein n=1 Tax=Oryzomonas sp. TaxID=2855186 RepID=UPI0028402F2A|nr:ATP-binding protein [Oryzomonas sp.]MDR3581144.1 ATP-binding protein [Oryzomonas sp.]